jgi:hypothetical protein
VQFGNSAKHILTQARDAGHISQQSAITFENAGTMFQPASADGNDRSRGRISAAQWSESRRNSRRGPLQEIFER